MKAVQVVGAVAMVLISAALDASAQQPLFKTKITVMRYRSISGETMETKAVTTSDFIALCTNSTSAQLVVALTNGVPDALLVVDPCGNLICTNIVITTNCVQQAGTSNGTVGKALIAARFSAQRPDGSLTGGGHIIGKATVNVTNSEDVSSYSAKGSLSLCDTNGNVYVGSLTISGAFKPGKNCP